MPRWVPQELWKGEDAFVIGGGLSLETFDWSLLVPELTIGCNSAYLRGPDVCKICVFGDQYFIDRFYDDVAEYAKTRPVFTNKQSLDGGDIPWLWTTPRAEEGLHHDALGWNGNTGAVALNLALVLGATRVFLLGFDMKRIKIEHKDGTVSDRPNWHTQSGPESTTDNVTYRRFNDNFRHVVEDWHKKFADRAVVNVTDDSDLEGFPKVGVQQFWAERLKQRGC